MTFWAQYTGAGTDSIAGLSGASNVATNTPIDLAADSGGQPLNLNSAILASPDLVQKVLVDLSWELLDDDGVTPLSLDEARAKLRSATSREAATANGLIVREPWTSQGSPANNAWFDLVEFTVPDGKAIAVDLKVFVRAGTDADMDIGSATMTFAARRRTGESVVVPARFSLDQSEGGIRFGTEGRASTVAIRARRLGAGAVLACYNGSVEVQS